MLKVVDYIFISTNLQEFVNDPSILTSLSIDHSPVHLSLSNENKDTAMDFGNLAVL